MKPLQALNQLQEAAALIAAGQPLPPFLRGWLCAAIRRKLADPSANLLDHLLALRSRHGGRLHAASRLPQRDQALLRLASTITGTQKTRAAELLRRLEAGDAEMLRIQNETCRIPRSARQLARIIGGYTSASMSLD